MYFVMCNLLICHRLQQPHLYDVSGSMTPALIHVKGVNSFPNSSLYILVIPGCNLHIRGIFSNEQHIKVTLIRD